MACFNEFGDEQLAIDVLANNVIFENLKASGCCATASSEETPVEDPMGGEASCMIDGFLGQSTVRCYLLVCVRERTLRSELARQPDKQYWFVRTPFATTAAVSQSSHKFMKIMVRS